MRLLLVSLASPGRRLRSSTRASTVWFPAVAAQVSEATPPLATRVTEPPGGSEAFQESAKVLGFPSTRKETPCTTPPWVAAAPWFLIVARKRTGEPATGFDGDHETSVTTRSGPRRSAMPPVTPRVTGPPALTSSAW